MNARPISPSRPDAVEELKKAWADAFHVAVAHYVARTPLAARSSAPAPHTYTSIEPQRD